MKIIIQLLFISFILSSCANNKVNIQSKNELSSFIDFKPAYTQEILKGSLTEYRDWWDVKHYSLTIQANYDDKFVAGTVNMKFDLIKPTFDSIIQVDLQNPMIITNIAQVIYDQSGKIKDFDLQPTAFKKIDDAYFIDLKQIKSKSKTLELKFYFEGHPKIAKNAPWDGGWVFSKDQQNRPWMSAAVEGIGASAWYPCKDHLSDEPDDGARISVLTKDDLVAVANGKMWETSLTESQGLNVYNWEVKNPINNYNMLPYIGHYVNFKDTYKGLKGDLELSYWVLDYNKEKATTHFKQTKEMLSCFEEWFGAYPFYEDGYKLVEAPYLGMEHQSNIAYGNYYLNGYMGGDLSGTGYGLDWDFIIVHESGHEWFGNSISMKDRADMWIHESFTNYSEVLFVECKHGLDAANQYVHGLRKKILNDSPIIGAYGVNQEGSGDMYFKGANLIHTLRQWIDDDVKFKRLLRNINKEFYHQTLTSKQIEAYIIEFTGLPLQGFFNQYLRNKQIPLLESKNTDDGTLYRWANVTDGFQLNLKTVEGHWIIPTTKWQLHPGELNVDENFYILHVSTKQ